MVDKIVKRDGRVVDFDDSKIFNAIMLAIYDAKEKDLWDLAKIAPGGPTLIAGNVTADVVNRLESIYDEMNMYPTVEQVQDIVIEELKETNAVIAEVYQEYRDARTKERARNTDLMKAIKRISQETLRDNANVGNNFSAKLLQIASISNQMFNLIDDIPEDIGRAHKEGLVHIHDLDSYNLTINCLQIDTGEVLNRGFDTGYGRINPPARIDSAAALSCILLQSSQNDMYGGQSHYDFDNDMAQFVKNSEEAIRKEATNFAKFLGNGRFPGTENEAELILESYVQNKLINTIHQSMQAVVYNLNSMHSRAGSQVPFSTINIGWPDNKYAAMVCEAFLREFDKGLGKGEPPIFPNVIFRVKKGINANPGDPYYYLKQLACKVAANRMNPTFLNCDADFNVADYKPATMGCRTRIANNVNGRAGAKNRGNIAPISINLPRLAIEANLDFAESGAIPYESFQRKLSETLLLCERQLLHRYQVLKKLKGKDLPFVVGQKLILGSEEVGPNDSIEPVLRQGTYAIGFIGLAEALTLLNGAHHGESRASQKMGLEIVKQIRKFCDELTVKHNLNFTLLATPAEGLSGRFAEIDKKAYGRLTGITDKDYYTNSFHIPVGFNMNIQEKIEIEALYHPICNAGHITYVELDRAPIDNPSIVEKIIDCAIRHNAGYVGVNFGMIHCKDCGRKHITDNICPACGGANLQKIDRVTGYLSLVERFTPGKVAELKDRVAHEKA